MLILSCLRRCFVGRRRICNEWTQQWNWISLLKTSQQELNFSLSTYLEHPQRRTIGYTVSSFVVAAVVFVFFLILNVIEFLLTGFWSRRPSFHYPQVKFQRFLLSNVRTYHKGTCLFQIQVLHVHAKPTLLRLGEFSFAHLVLPSSG